MSVTQQNYLTLIKHLFSGLFLYKYHFCSIKKMTVFTLSSSSQLNECVSVTAATSCGLTAK